MNLEFSAIAYRSIRDRIRQEDPHIDEQTLADTVEGLTDLHEILTVIIRAALTDQALAAGLKGRIAEVNLTSGRSSVQLAHLYPRDRYRSHHCFDSGMRPCAMQSVSVGPSTSARASG